MPRTRTCTHARSHTCVPPRTRSQVPTCEHARYPCADVDVVATTEPSTADTSMDPSAAELHAADDDAAGCCAVHSDSGSSASGAEFDSDDAALRDAMQSAGISLAGRNCRVRACVRGVRCVSVNVAVCVCRCSDVAVAGARCATELSRGKDPKRLPPAHEAEASELGHPTALLRCMFDKGFGSWLLKCHWVPNRGGRSSRWPA